MTKILIVGDIHAQDKGPDSMHEGYADDLLGMLDYIAEMSQDYSATIWAGDVFHHKNPLRTSHNLVARMITVALQTHNLYIVEGNHDRLYDQKITRSSNQPLQSLYSAGIKQLEGWNCRDSHGRKLPVYGIPWQQDWHSTEPYTLEEVFSDWNMKSEAVRKRSLVVTHAPIYPPHMENQMFELIPTQDIANIMGYGSLYHGHIHEDHGTYRVDNVQFANVGALSRGSLHEYNVHRKIQVCEWDNTREDSFKPIVIPHKPAEEIFKLEEHEEKKETERVRSEFINSLHSVTLSTSDIESVIENLRTRNIDSRLRDKAIELLREA